MSELPDRLARLTDSLGQHGIDALLVTDEINVRYLSGFTGDSSYLLVTPAETAILSDGRYEAQIAEQCGYLPCFIRPPSDSLFDLTEQVLNQKITREGGPRKLGVEADHLSMNAYQMLVERCSEVEFVATSGVVEGLRIVKDPREIEITRRAVRVAERAFESLLPMLSPEWTERQVAHELEAKMRFLGAEGCSFAPIVAFGPAGALPHYSPGDRLLGDASTILIDWGAKLGGYASDLTRTLHRETASAEFRRCYEAVLEAQLAAIEAIGPGAAASDVDRAARAVLQRAGLDAAFKHGLGHGVGLQIHESPRISSSSDETLVSGMIVTVEPGVYFDGDFGIRIEDDVLVTDSGCEVLSRLPKGLDDCRFIL
jgi:Xaa-Pro aminopeptidase